MSLSIRVPTLKLALLLACYIFCAARVHAVETQILKDLPYKTGKRTAYEQERCKLDLYLPADTKDFPTVVWFHGGGLQGGDKRGGYIEAMGRRFAAEGIAVASVNYRLSPQVSFPAYIDDAAAAFAFVRNEIAKQGGSPNRVFISGHSAGGYLTAMLGLDEQYLARYGLKITDIAGLMPISGQMITHTAVREERKISKTQPIIDEAAPAFHVRPDCPAFLVFAGSNDLPTRAEENRYFAAAMKAAGHKDVAYLEVEGRDHGTVGSQLGDSDDIVAKTIIAFIEQHEAQPSPPK
jgi:acetyl esterase/lipase